MPVRTVGAAAAPELARALVAQAAAEDVVWVVSADGDPGLTDAIASEVSRLPAPPEVEVVVGLLGRPGRAPARPRRGDGPAALAGRLPLGRRADPRVTGEVPHRGGPRGRRGDRVGRPRPHGRGARRRAAAGGLPVAGGGGARPGALRHRRRGRAPSSRSSSGATPTCSPRATATTPEEVEGEWERIKARERAEKGGHGGGEAGHDPLLHGIPASLPSLLAAEKVLSRWERSGGDLAALSADDGDLGRALLGLVARARERGESAESLLRAAVRDFAAGTR